MTLAWFVIALTSAFLVGYSTSGQAHAWVSRAMFSLVIVATVYVILDMELPRAGLIQVGVADDAMAAARRAMGD